MRALFLCLFLTACSTTWDPHSPGTVTAPEKGGDVEVQHGQRLQVKLPAAAQGNEWRTREPMTVMVIAETAPEPDGLRMTPVRSGKETLRFEEVPLRGEGAALRSVTYQVTVP